MGGASSALDKARKMVVTTSTDKSPSEIAPPWIHTVQVPPECAGDGFGGTSDGISPVNATTVTRFRAGHFDSDGAKWSRGFTSGKHAFEITFPQDHRGGEATVGVGTDAAPLYMRGKVPLIGQNAESWGISLRSKRALHRNAQVKKYPSTQNPLPDTFYMYLDADSGCLQFGAAGNMYFGASHNGIKHDKPLYPMVCATAPGATISMRYLGTANTGALGPQPVQVTTVVVQQTAPPPPAAVVPPPPPPADPPAESKPESEEKAKEAEASAPAET